MEMLQLDTTALFDSDIIFEMNGNYYPWPVAGPMMVSQLAFGKMVRHPFIHWESQRTHTKVSTPVMDQLIEENNLEDVLADLDDDAEVKKFDIIWIATHLLQIADDNRKEKAKMEKDKDKDKDKERDKDREKEREETTVVSDGRKKDKKDKGRKTSEGKRVRILLPPPYCLTYSLFGITYLLSLLPKAAQTSSQLMIVLRHTARNLRV